MNKDSKMLAEAYSKVGKEVDNFLKTLHNKDLKSKQKNLKEPVDISHTNTVKAFKAIKSGQWTIDDFEEYLINSKEWETI